MKGVSQNFKGIPLDNKGIPRWRNQHWYLESWDGCLFYMDLCVHIGERGRGCCDRSEYYVTSKITIYAVDVNQKSMHLQIVKGKFWIP